MKKILITIMVAILTLTNVSEVFAEDTTCVMLKFENLSRFKNVDTATVLSDLVLEKLLMSGKFNLTETKPLEANLEEKLYDGRKREFANLSSAVKNKNLSILFENGGFNPKQANDISVAEVGQVILPEITSKIGREHNAQYLIQGNIVAFGNGKWTDVQVITAQTAAAIASNFVPGAAAIFGAGQETVGVGIVTDLKIIKAENGEVVWKKRVTGKKTKKMTSVLGLSFGSEKLTSEMYTQALEDAVNQIVDALTNDLTAYKLILR